MITAERLFVVRTGVPLAMATDGHADLRGDVPGFILFGYWEEESRSSRPTPKEVSNCLAGMEFGIKNGTWFESPRVYSIEVLVTEWGPSLAWRTRLECALTRFVEAGALVAWCADELGSPSVSDLDPELATGEVYAAFTPSTGLVCNAELDEEYAYLADAQLRLFTLAGPPNA